MKKDIIDQVAERRKLLYKMGGEDEVRAHHEQNKLTARERIELLFDEGSFVEIQPFMKKEGVETENVITGYGTVGGRPVCVFSQDHTLNAGRMGEYHALKIASIIEHAMKTGVPVLGFLDSEGLNGDIETFSSFGKIMRVSSLASGVIPQISIVAGKNRIPLLSDFIIMTKNGVMYNMEPSVIKAVTDESVTEEDIGGWEVSLKNGNCHIVADSDEDAIQAFKDMLDFLPLNNLDDSPIVENEDDPARTTPEIRDLIPDDPNKVYDMKKVISVVFDEGQFFETQSMYARSIVTGFARIDSRTAGIVANNPKFNAGCLDLNSCRKAARFVRFCDAFNIPIVTFVDVPGFFPGIQEEYGGILRSATKLFYSYSEATVPLITIVVRRGYGIAFAAMGSKYIGADIVYAYPSAEIELVDPATFVELEFSEKIANAENPNAERQKLIEDYRNRAGPWEAAKIGDIDDVIDPKYTRSRIVGALRFLETKRDKLPPKKHGNMPL